jgi:energy-coupling factor transporter ATP-binding protein EcfA2
MIRAEHITKKYAEHTALNDVSLHIPKGSLYGLLGPNGAGKTTFLRILNQIIDPDQGQVLLDGRPLRREDIARIGYLPEEEWSKYENEYCCDNCGGGFIREEMDFDVNDQDLCKNCSKRSVRIISCKILCFSVFETTSKALFSTSRANQSFCC